MTDEQKKMLRQLADHLDKIPESGFDMANWIVRGEDQSDLEQANENNYECGLAACVGGHAALLFPEKFIIVNEALYSLDRTRHGAQAIADVFGLPFPIAFDLTSYDAPHQTSKNAATAIRHLIAHGTLPENDGEDE